MSSQSEWLNSHDEDVRLPTCSPKGGTDTSQGKVNILLQAHISKAFVEDFALVSDTAYAAQVSQHF